MPRDPREYITVVATMPEHEKVEGLSDAAFRLIVELWCWSKRQRTDGAVPRAVWMRRRSPKVRAELVTAGLVEHADPHDDGSPMLLHDYAEHQWTEAQAVERSAVRAEAGRRGGLAKAAKRAGKPVANASNGLASAVANPGNGVAEEEVEEEQEEQTPPNPPAGGVAVVDVIASEFDRFWQAYPRKVGKPQALKAYRAARRKVDRDRIAEAFHPFAAAMRQREPDKVPHASTWLNREPWHDDPEALAPTTVRRHDGTDLDLDAARARARIRMEAGA